MTSELLVPPRPQCLNVTLNLQKSSQVKDFLKKACVKSILLHLLYSRQIIPLPAEEIFRICSSKQDEPESQPLNVRKRSRRDLAMERKLMKNGDKMMSMLKDLDNLFGAKSLAKNNNTEQLMMHRQRGSGVKAVLITIGPSFQSPREQYLIRFHFGDGASDDDQFLPPPHIQHRLEQEISRRAIRETIQGTLQDEYSKMFELPTLRGAGSQSTMKVNLAFLLSQTAANELFESNELDSLEANMNDDDSMKPEFQNALSDANGVTIKQSLRYLMQRNFSIRTPRMRSKRLSIYRPFVVLDVIPCIKSSLQSESKDTHGFLLNDDDIWLSLRKPLKGFKLE